MRARSSSARSTCWAWLPAALLVLLVTGCGGSHLGTPKLPLVSGAQVVAQARRCDEGTHVFCALDMVIVAPSFHSAQDLMTEQRRRLRSLGWELQQTEVGQEQSAVSPGQKFRLIYATAAGDLLAVDQGWVDRPRLIAVALAHTLFDRLPALSLRLQAGPS
ncbi:MAG: hypothetical protein ACJ764_02145 [Solirubrobacteraceae bacterium]